ncbi:vacuolar protein sorting-associated protein 18 homolog [Amphibalanus amphitrite]|uniref:vacuolar protein sorting-associated protein 18 homolog n=1 Tax=Amphibalanus amphitrite TaxID=1232801 RepID=UPI001C915C01|nr:vacuolar protein sorting-associated protein 18 homolog [Amphibalanus amphitrite]XP_043212480.1 vacuolar protein sorting-associated protein 18 homolog [Amphibalanus amphitrite]XP_043212481.1 vacuolar protein sorting-associated protein 18 homolog [Amphibalanus amphitrite]
MASLLEQYAQSSQAAGPRSVPAGASASVVQPIFTKQKVNFQPTSPITHLVVANHQLVVALANKTLLRIDLMQPDQPHEVDLSKETAGCRVQQLYLDPSGHHLLVAAAPRDGDLTGAQLLYLPGRAVRARQVGQLRGQLITAVGWSHTLATPATTGPLLAGNSQGVVTELELTADERRFSRLEVYNKQVLELSPPASVTGLEYHRVPDTDRYLALVATAGRLYQYTGTVPAHDARPLLTPLFAVQERFLEIPSSLSFSRLAFFYPRPGAPPERFAWLTEPGVLVGRVDTDGTDGLVTDTHLLAHDTNGAGAAGATGAGGGAGAGGGQQRHAPRALALTEFHVLLLQPARVRATCVLDQRHVFEDLASEAHGPLLTICRDPIHGTLWSAAERAVYKYKVVDETRDVWQVFVSKGQYDLARQHCQSNPAVVDRITAHQAEDCFDKGEFARSAELFADSRCRLEEVALKFMGKEEYGPLRQFLMMRLSSLPASGGVRAALLVIWCLELFLTQLDRLEEEEEQSRRKLRKEMMQFLTSQRALDHVRQARSTMYDLMSRHGDWAAVTELAELLGDWETVVRHHLKNGHVTKALETLRRHPDPQLLCELVPQLVRAEPTLTIDLVVAQGRKLKPALLMPRLILADTSEEQGQQILRYLEFCVNTLESTDNVAHNYLVTLYTRYRPDKLMAYLHGQGSDRHCVHYTPGHVLRQCFVRQPRAAVHVLTVVGRYQEAVELALKHDVALAKQVANLPEDDDTLKKRLWLLIAKHTIQCDQDVQRTMQFLAECRLLRIEDVLPFFPDFVTIDDFKEAICDSLQSYNEHIGELRTDMEEAARATELLRTEIEHFREGYVTVQASDTCQICRHQLLTRPLYVFPCGHKFHQDCLADEVTPLLSQEQRDRVAELEHKLTTLPEDDLGSAAAGGVTQVSPRVTVREELDELVAAECLYCGDYLIRVLDEPLLNDFPER